MTDCLNPEKLSSGDKLLDLDIVLPTTHFLAHADYFQTIESVGQPQNMSHVKNAGSKHQTTVAFRDAPLKQYGHAQWKSLNTIKHELNIVQSL